jgi:hypothetical protein
MTEKITYAELQEKLSNPEISEAELAQYFVMDKTNSQPFSPVWEVNETIVEDVPAARGQGLFNLLNNAARDRRKRLFEKRRKDMPQRPILVSEGDSWFQFPLVLKDVIDQLIEENSTAYKFNVFSLDAAGDTLENMIANNPEFLKAIDDVQAIGLKVSGFVFSGGGNDLLGTDKMGKPVLHSLLHRDLPNPTIDNVFRPDEVTKLFEALSNYYKQLFQQVHDRYPNLPIFIHGYDYVYPGEYDASDRRSPSYAGKKQWLGQPMEQLGIRDKGLQREIVKRLLDRFHTMQQSLVASHANVHLIETLGTLENVQQWNDEIHPNDVGFAKVGQKFITKINQIITP